MSRVGGLYSTDISPPLSLGEQQFAHCIIVGTTVRPRNSGTFVQDIVDFSTTVQYQGKPFSSVSCVDCESIYMHLTNWPLFRSDRLC